MVNSCSQRNGETNSPWACGKPIALPGFFMQLYFSKKGLSGETKTSCLPSFMVTKRFTLLSSLYIRKKWRVKRSSSLFQLGKFDIK